MLAKLTSQGHSISSIAGKTLEQLKALAGSTENNILIQRNVYCEKLMATVDKFQLSDFFKEIQHLRLTLGVKEFVFDVVLETIRRVGDKVAHGQYSITKEHIISTMLRDQLAKINLPNFTNNPGEFVLATPDGNMHELSIIIADIICRYSRKETHFLGAGHPAMSLAEALNAFKSEYLILGVISSDKWDFENNIFNYLEGLDRGLNHKMKVILGGAFPIELPSFKNIEKVICMGSFEELHEFVN